MNAIRPTGLGEPDVDGKLSLFRPPDSLVSKRPIEVKPLGVGERSEDLKSKRVRTTVDLTWNALQVVQGLQQQHRLKTGKVLPLWKAVSQAIEGFAKAGADKKS